MGLYRKGINLSIGSYGVGVNGSKPSATFPDLFEENAAHQIEGETTRIKHNSSALYVVQGSAVQ